MSEPDPFKINEAVIDLWRCYTIERDMAKELEAENARLKAELDKVDQQRRGNLVDAGSLFQENARLKAEVERSKRINTELLVLSERQASDIRSLTKAGDAMHKFVIAYIVDNRVSSAYLNKLDDGWVNAKQGDQRP